MKRRLWVGLDAGANSISVCVIDAAGQVQREASCQSDVPGVRRTLKGILKSQIVAMGIEAGSFATHLVRNLRAIGYPVVVFETRQSSRFLGLKRNKTDANDARGLAEMARVGRSVVSEVRVKSIECQSIRSQLVLRQRLLQQRMALEESLRALLRLHGCKPVGRRISRAQVTRDVKRLMRSEGLDISRQVAPLIDLTERMSRHIAYFDQELSLTAASHSICSRLMEIPGVGPITALSFYSAIEEPTRFARNTDVGAFLGLTPTISQSGQTLRSGRISKMGNRLTRSHLILAAQVHLLTVKADTALKRWGASLVRRVGVGKARVAVARKLSIIMLCMWKHGSNYNPSPDGPPLTSPLPSTSAAA